MSPAEVAADFADDLSRVVQVAKAVSAGLVTEVEGRWLISDVHSRLRVRDGMTVQAAIARLRELGAPS